MFHSAAVLRASGDDVEPGRLNTRMTEKIGQLGDILFQLIKRPGKQMAQVMGKHLFRRDPCFRTQRFHGAPDIGAVDGAAGTRDKEHTAFDSLFRRIAEQLLLQLADDENRPCLGLAGHYGLAALCGFDRYMLQLTDADAGAANRLQYQAKTPVPAVGGGAAKP